MANKVPIKYAPPSPKNSWAFGKLNIKNVKIIIFIKNKIYKKYDSLLKSRNNNVIKIIKE